METIRNIIFEYANLLVLVPILMWFLVPARYAAVQKIILVFLLLSALTQLVSFIFWKLQKNNLPLLHIYTVFECLILLRLYYSLLGTPGRKILFTIAAIFFSLFALADALYLDGIFEFNIYSRSVEALLIITLCIGWFMKAVSLDDSRKEMFKGINIINSGFLIYFAGAITLFSYSSFISNMTFDVGMNIWTLHTLLAVQLYILIAIGLWKTRTK